MKPLLLGFVSFAFSFQFFTRLAAVFAEEVGGFCVPLINRQMQRSPSPDICIHIRTFCDEYFDNFLVA